MAIIGLGTDIVEIARIETQLTKSTRLAARVLTVEELSEFESHKQPARFLAKRFAAKEAASKAFGTGIGRGISFQHFYIDHNEDGKPLLILRGNAKNVAERQGVNSVHISISDEQHYATATVIIEAN